MNKGLIYNAEFELSQNHYNDVFAFFIVYEYLIIWDHIPWSDTQHNNFLAEIDIWFMIVNDFSDKFHNASI